MKFSFAQRAANARLFQGASGIAAFSIFTWTTAAGLSDDNDNNFICTTDAEGKNMKTAHRIFDMMNQITPISIHKVRLEAAPEKTIALESPATIQSDAKPVREKTTRIVEYDFVVMGHGNAGKSAVQTLKEQCPGATIALVDPLRPVSTEKSKVEYYAQSALGFHPPTRTVQLADRQLKYKYAILVATGSRGAPPPMSLIDAQCLSRVLELRPTEALGNTKRPVLAPETVRQIVLMAASQGAKVCVLGSSWEAIELAVAASKTNNAQSPLLAFGSAGPLCHVLPRYLSTAVTKRLRYEGIDMQERSLVRYVAHHTSSKTHRMEVHTAKSFDLLDTQRNLVDLLVVAPNVNGLQGTAVLPSLEAPHELEAQSYGKTWFQTWSQLSSPPSEPSTIVCYTDDGRISVNAELNAANKVFAAGSVAKYPNSTTGHAHVAGEGSVDGALAGHLAALHMARDYQERNRSVLSTARVDTIEPASFASKSFPIFRSDISPYSNAEGNESTLSKAGISALVVGHCDANKMATHGFWWTNAAEKRHMSDSRHSRRRKTKIDNNYPIYGSGIVFYLDGTGRIRGIMSWGLPITAKDSMELNQNLVDRMVDVITTNGGVTQRRSPDDVLLKASHLAAESKRLVQIALSGQHRSRSNRRRMTGKMDEMGKPLHRYTDAKSPTVTSMGLLKRKDQSFFSELLGENIYIKDDNTFDDNEITRPPSLLYIYPMHSPQWGMGDNKSDEEQRNPYLPSQDERIDEAWKDNERRARPPKEEPLWLRRGDALRAVNMQEVMNETFLSNMRSGRFADGTEPFQRAKVPKAVQDASETLQQFLGRSEKEDDAKDAKED